MLYSPIEIISVGYTSEIILKFCRKFPGCIPPLEWQDYPPLPEEISVISDLVQINTQVRQKNHIQLFRNNKYNYV
jgi:hypothetical protein